ncbi:MAG: PKD domain-containing protein, partial [Actinobacteria bacterium]|nr:PKD domain-containing protein [Actinomycetota bacterium]
VIFVGSSDPRIGAGPSGTDTHLDTNSGILTRLTWNGSNWEHLDLVRGLPRSEENHSINGLQLDESANTLYAAIGGFTNLGAPSNNFALVPEYALAAAILSIDLDAIGESTYDLPTLDDEDRGGVGQPPENDPFGGNNGKNQAILVPEGPVQVFSPGWRNIYDVLLTETGRFYTVDNGANGGWGDVPEFEGPGGACTNAVREPGFFTPDNLHFITEPGYYGGHPNPTRASTANTFNASNPQSPVPSGNPIECDFRMPGEEDGSLATFIPSTNGLAEYGATTFDGQMRGDLLMAAFSNEIFRVKLNGAGDTAVLVETLFSSVGVIPLDVTAQDDGGAYPGTIWVADYIGGDIVVYEPDSAPGPVCIGAYDPGLDEDGDGYDNADEIDNGTNPCNGADVPPDTDGDFVSDLNDPDDDNDGQPDTSDPFSVDPDNGTTTNLPALFSWDNGAPPVGGLLGLGFTGLMTNGNDDYADLFDPGNMAAGG